MDNNIFINKVTNKEDINKCLNIRYEVFVKNQNVPEHREIDGKDNEAEHFLLLSNNTPIATARMRYKDSFTAKIERMAVLDQYQGNGFGKKLMLFILDYLQNTKKIRTAVLSSQTYAIPFYENLGFVVVSDEYFDAGISHKDMQKKFNLIQQKGQA